MKILKKVLAFGGIVAVVLSLLVFPSSARTNYADNALAFTSPIAPLLSSFGTETPLFNSDDNVNPELTPYGQAYGLEGASTVVPLAYDPVLGMSPYYENGYYYYSEAGWNMAVYDLTGLEHVNDPGYTEAQQEWLATQWEYFDNNSFESYSGSVNEIKQMYGSLGLVDIRYTFDRREPGAQKLYFTDVYDTFATHVDWLQLDLSYASYAECYRDTLLDEWVIYDKGLSANVYFHVFDGQEWQPGVANFEAIDPGYAPVYDSVSGTYLKQYNLPLGGLLRDFILDYHFYDSAFPFVVIDSVQVGSTSNGGSLDVASKPPTVVIRHNLGSVVPNTYDLLSDSGDYYSSYPDQYWEGSTGNALGSLLFTGSLGAGNGSLNPGVDVPSDIPSGIEGVVLAIGAGIGGFLSFSIVPGITLGGILATVICIALFITFLKMFAGG